MALLRLIAIACVGCHQAAEAGPGSGITPPAGWQPMPALATAAADAARTDAVTVESSEAWGEPAMGCYAAWIALAGGAATVDKLTDQLLAGVAGEPALAGIAVTDVVKPTSGGGVLALTFERAPYHGRLRAQLGHDGKVAALACFWNAREPVACDAACTQLIGSLK